MPKISVIVPIYGVEKYIERCAVHLFEQTLDDIEYIFVDDCTKDNSMYILQTVIERYPNRQRQVHIIHHDVNKGLSRARQTGVQIASGEYIAHCDSDDWIDKEMYEVMYNLAVKNNSDVVKCGHKITTDTEIIKINNVFFEEDIIPKTKAISWLLTYKGWNSIWDTIVKRSIYTENSIQFTDIAMLEDMFVMSQIYSYSNKIDVIQTPFYNYYLNPKSICGTSNENDYIRRANQAKQNLDIIITFIDALWGTLFSKEIIVAKTLPRNILINILGKKDNYKYWNLFYPEIKWSIYTLNRISFIQKIRFLIAELQLYPLYACLKSHIYRK